MLLASLMSCHSRATHGDGGDGGGLACKTISPCGGDVVGVWSVTDSCLSGTDDLSSTCAGLSADLSLSVSGTTTYNADQTFTATVTGSGTTVYHYPAACIPGTATCTQLGQTLMAIGMYSSVTCTTDSGGICNCVAITTVAPTTEMGTYSTSGSTLSVTQNGTTSTSPYCVNGDLLYEMNAPGDGGAAITGSIVLMRQ